MVHVESRGLLTAFCAVAVTTASTAEANVAAPPPDQNAKLSAPRPPARTPLVVEHETLVFTCRRSPDVPRCTFRAVYAVHNPTDQAVEQLAAFFAVRTEGVQVQVGGRSAERELTAEQSAQMRALVEEQVPEREGTEGPTLHGLAFHAEPGARMQLVVEGVTLPGVSGVRAASYTVSGIRARHLLFGSDEVTRPVVRYDFDYLVSPIRTWGGVGRIDVEVHYDDAWDLAGGLDVEGGTVAFEDAGDDGELAVARLHTSGREQPGDLRILFEDAPVPIYHGGPIVGVGGQIDDQSEFRVRLGWELATPTDWLVWSAVVDTDFDREVVVAPMVEAVSGQFFFLPSLATGLGVPVRVAPEVQAGVRLQGTLGFYPLGFVTAFDFYPAVARDQLRAFDATLLLRTSL